MMSRPQVERIGHRGAPNERLENTLPSFQRAVELGATAVELDVHVTADGVPVVHHDAELHADVAPARFARARIASLDSRDLSQIRLGSGEPIPRLGEVFDLLPPAINVYVEIKGGSPAIIGATVLPFASRAAVHSFDHDVIAEMRRIAPAIARGLLIEKRPKDLRPMMARAGATDVWPAWKLVDASFMAEAVSCGARVIPWTVNASRDVKKLADLGVAGICTNDLTLFDGIQQTKKTRSP
jgi:glycerophosphoryl diester phosphodiesterase